MLFTNQYAISMPEALNSLSSNPYFSAGFGLVGLTTVLAILRRGSITIGNHLYRKFTSSLEISKDDKSYEWLLHWFSSNNFQTSHRSVFTDFQQCENGKFYTSFIFPPSIGVHFFKYRGKYIKAERSRSSSLSTASKYGPSHFETISLMTYGRDHSIFTDLLLEARNEALSQNSGKTITFIPDSVSWRIFGHPKVLRPLESVIMDDGITESIIGDITEFINSSEWYRERGIPHRRGYLLYGPPGCGKTSLMYIFLIRDLQSLLNLGEPGLSDDRLMFLLNTAPLQSLIVLEDIDAVVVQEDTKRTNKLTNSGLLNALDGVTSSEQRIIFMTTNHPEKLHPALIRPGRVDVKQLIGYMSRIQIARMFQRFYAGVDSKDIETFSNNILSLNISMTPAFLQAYLLRYKDKPESAIQNFRNLIDHEYSFS